jgi:hypothetical protein
MAAVEMKRARFNLSMGRLQQHFCHFFEAQRMGAHVGGVASKTLAGLNATGAKLARSAKNEGGALRLKRPIVHRPL